MAKLAKKHFEQFNLALELQNTAQTMFPCVKAHLRLQLTVFRIDTLPVHTECGSIASPPPRPCPAVTQQTSITNVRGLAVEFSIITKRCVSKTFFFFFGK